MTQNPTKRGMIRHDFQFIERKSSMIFVPMITILQVLAIAALIAVLALILFLLNQTSKLVSGALTPGGAPGAGSGSGTPPAKTAAEKATDLAMDLAAEQRTPTAQECTDLAGWRDEMAAANVRADLIARVDKMLTNLCGS
jgi:hypothetical protein